MSEKRLNIFLLVGGSSSEREVSLSSAKNVKAALSEVGHTLCVYDLKGASEYRSLLSDKSLYEADIVFPLIHGGTGEDGRLQSVLETLGLKFVGSGSFASTVGFHKSLCKKYLDSKQVQLIPSFDFNASDNIESFVKRNSLEDSFFNNHYFIKACRQGSSIGVYPYEPVKQGSNRENFFQIVQRALEFDDSVLVEQAIVGRELSCTVFKGDSLPVVEVKTKQGFYDYENKYTKGNTAYECPAVLSKNVVESITKQSEYVFESLGCQDFARVDFILKGNTPYFLEVNTVPGMTETSLVPKSAKANGLSYKDFLDQLVCYSFKRQS